jgi:hypothetical protein
MPNNYISSFYYSLMAYIISPYFKVNERKRICVCVQIVSKLPREKEIDNMCVSISAKSKSERVCV